MSLSMKKANGGRGRLPYIIAIVAAAVLAFALVAFLPLAFEIKKLLFFIFIIGFSILAVLVTNLARRK